MAGQVGELARQVVVGDHQGGEVSVVEMGIFLDAGEGFDDGGLCGGEVGGVAGCASCDGSFCMEVGLGGEKIIF